MRYRCSCCGEAYDDDDVGCCIAGCYCPDLDEEPDDEDDDE